MTGTWLVEAQTALARASLGTFFLNGGQCQTPWPESVAPPARGCVSVGASAPPILAKQVVSSHPPARPKC